jgi:hypothetical protein
MAPPTPGFSPPEHPFVDAFSHAPEHEHTLRMLLLDSHDGRDFLNRLIAAGYDVAAEADRSAWHFEGPAARVYRGNDPRHPIAAIWPNAGLVDDLSDDRSGVPSDAFALTVYEPAFSMALKRIALASASFADLVSSFQDEGFTIAGGPAERPWQ